MKEDRKIKTKHQIGYKKPQRNPTTNYPPDEHSLFCKRCFNYNGCCPKTERADVDSSCSL